MFRLFRTDFCTEALVVKGKKERRQLKTDPLNRWK